MQKQNSNKTILIIIALLILGVGAYFYFTGTPTDTDPGLALEGGVSSDASLVGGRVLVLLNQIKVLKIDSEFFRSPAYSSLVDHTVPIYEQNVGKPNPFHNPRPAPATTQTSSR